MVHDERRRGVCCPHHPGTRGQSTFLPFNSVVQSGNDFLTIEKQNVFLTACGMRLIKGPLILGITVLACRLASRCFPASGLNTKSKMSKAVPLKIYGAFISRAQEYFGDKNVKYIQFAELEDFFLAQKLSNKTKSNLRSCLHTFWSWLLNRKVISKNDFPDFPKISFELGWRKTVDKETQQAIIDEIKSLSYFDQSPDLAWH